MDTIVTTTQPVKYRGWTLPAGAAVTVDYIVLARSWEQHPNATCFAADHQPLGNISVPIHALPSEVWTMVPVKRFDEDLGRLLPI